MRTIHLSFLGVIHKIFQLELLAIPKHDLLCKAKLAGKNVRKSYIRMRPAAIALNYSVKDIRNDVHQIISGSMTGDHNRPCYQDVKLSPSDIRLHVTWKDNSYEYSICSSSFVSQ